MSNSADILELANRIEAARKDAGKTYTWLAETTGIPYSSLRRKLIVNPDTIAAVDISRIARALDVSFTSLAGGGR